ncbi:unnamed protein product [Nesidiocoris tenuis]|uniref:Uncharacterized protein n=1 Tax=Nesidiocoris tenuis TaxID=355587 RepID=A0A6H5GX41_9HEMI|nr:unnamed protein product [Nesidiocoris tenuis]
MNFDKISYAGGCPTVKPISFTRIRSAIYDLASLWSSTSPIRLVRCGGKKMTKTCHVDYWSTRM